MEWSSTICVQTNHYCSSSGCCLPKKKQGDALKNGKVLSYIVYQTCPNMDDQALVNREFSVVVLTLTHQVLRRHHQCCSIGSRQTNSHNRRCRNDAHFDLC